MPYVAGPTHAIHAENTAKFGAYMTKLMTSQGRTPPTVAWLTQALPKLAKRLRHDGLSGALSIVRANLKHAQWRWRDSRFDRHHGVRTTEYILPQHLDVPQEKMALSSEYEPSSARALQFILDNLGIDLNGLTFIDYGSGMGRALLIASDYPFKRVLGVELSRHLHEIAEANIKSYRAKSRRCFDTTSICMDAVDFSAPQEPCVIYLFDPFRKQVLEAVAANLERSYLEYPRPLFVIYYAPVHREVLDHATFLTQMGAMALPADRSALRHYGVAIYASNAWVADSSSVERHHLGDGGPLRHPRRSAPLSPRMY
jgi:hypothetical protein